MDNALLLSLFIALVTNGLYKASGEGMILHPFDRALYRLLPKWLYMPIIGCVPCMASVWGTLVFALHWLLYTSLSWYWWPFVVLASVALGTLVWFWITPKEKAEDKPLPPITGQKRTPITPDLMAERGYLAHYVGGGGVKYRFQHSTVDHWWLTRNEADFSIENYVLRWQNVNGQWLETMEQVELYEKAHP